MRKSAVLALLKKRYLLLIFSVTLILRLVFSLWANYSPGADYAAITEHITSQKNYSIDGIHPTALRTPLYPLFLAFLQTTTGNGTVSFMIFAAILSALNACLCAYLAGRIFNLKIGLISGAIYAFIPYLAQKEMTSENGLLAFLLLAALCLFWKARQNKDIILIGFCGICLGLSYLVRPTTGLIPFFLALVVLADKAIPGNLSRRFSASLLLLAACFITILPWGARNKAAFGKWYFGQTNFWYNLYIGNHPRTFEIYPRASLDNLIRTTGVDLPKGDDFAHEEWFYQQAVANIRLIGPEKFSFNHLRKLGFLWHIRLVPHTQRIADKQDTLRLLDVRRDTLKELAYSIPWILLIALTLIGRRHWRRRRKLLLFLLGFLLFFSLPYIITFSYSRYATPAYFIIIIMAAQGVAHFLPKNYTCEA